jgi:osmotically inducible protein OsmC
MTITNSATAQWKGGLKDGGGSISTGSGTLNDVAYDFGKRFESAQGTNPEELIGAAHAGCFSMAFSSELEKAGHQASSINTEATVTLDPETLSVTAVHLTTRGKVPGADQASFEKAANDAKQNCPISKLLNADITMEAVLED